MDILNEEYLKTQLITYLGNKRRLLPLIYKAINSTGVQNGTFLDLFAGSGVVSRLARLMGFQGIANDWEDFSCIISRAFLGLDAQSLAELFGSEKILTDLLDHINHLPDPPVPDQYMARYYAPASRDNSRADYRTERLFYTRDNALRIDRIRNYIEDYYPEGQSPKEDKIRSLLIALLLVEASRHTNTSGVFKACHKGFGGFGKDALARILAPITLSFPCLPPSALPGIVYCEDANRLVRNLEPCDVAYLDPPYNQHQYGSNYHILTTIVRWDKIPVPLELTEKGVLKEKAGIRKDWVNTRSPYCSRKKAPAAFADLLDHLEASHILMSYSSDGIIPFEALLDICEKKGKVGIISDEYGKFKGGRQSRSRLHDNIEYVITIDCSHFSSRASRNEIHRVLLLRELGLLRKRMFSSAFLEKIRDRDNPEVGKLWIPEQGNLQFVIDRGLFVDIADDLSFWTIQALEELLELLSREVLATRGEELALLLSRMEKDAGQAGALLEEVPSRLRMLAHKNTREEFEHNLKRLEALGDGIPFPKGFEKKIQSIRIQAEKRFKERGRNG